MCDADTRARTDDTVMISITLHQGRESVSVCKEVFRARYGAILAAVLKNILKEAQCPTPDE